MFRRLLLGAFFLLLLTLTGKADEKYQIQSWLTDEGLPQNTVSAIVQSPDGYLWMTTLDGLARFDGIRFTVFNKQNTAGFSANRLNQMIQSPDGDLWIGAESDWVIRYHAGVFSSYPLGDPGSPSNQIISLALDDQGKAVVFANSGMFSWTGETFEPRRSLAGENNRSVILWSNSGAFWYADKSLLHRLKDGVVTDFRLPGDVNVFSIVKLFEDSRKRLWVSTLNGLFVVENEQIKPFSVINGLLGKDAKPSLEDRSGNIWMATNEGVAIVAPSGIISKVTTEQGLSDNFTTTVFQDREGSFWIGTFRRGLNRLSRRTISFYSPKDGLAAPVVHPIYQLVDGDILFGGDGLTRRHNDRFSQFPGSSLKGETTLDVATAITQDRTGRIWFGHWSGVYYYENGRFSNFTGRIGQKITVVDIHEDSVGALWFASGGGLFRFVNNTVEHFTKAEDGLVGDDVKVIHESPGGALWFGTYSGLSRYQNGVFTNYTTSDGLASNQLRSIYEDTDGVLWLGSYDGGLTRFKDGQFTRYTVSNGLFNDGVFQILEDSRGNLWMSSNRGIYRVAKKQLNDFADGIIDRIGSVGYGKSDGLLETECNGGQQPAGIKTTEGKLWFPTQGGVAVIDPESVTTNPIPPPVVIEAATIDGVPTPSGSEINVLPGKNNLEIRYTGLSFVKPELVKFRYRLEGRDTEWIEAGTRRTAYYSYLPPGEYTFKVTAANSDGIWNETGAEVKVRVVAPYYQTGWFTALLISATIGLIALFYNWRVRKLRRQQVQQEVFSRRLIESQEQERNRIASELHDGLSQALVIIKHRADLSLGIPEESEHAFEQLEEISSTAAEAMLETKEIIYNLRPVHINRFGLTKSIEAMLKRISEVQDIRFEIEIDELNHLLPKESENSFYRILQESVNNIVKHSQATVASITIKHNNDLVATTISDNGRGFDAAGVQDEYHYGGFGLLGIIERSRLLGGEASIHSVAGNGTIIKILLPVKDYPVAGK